MEGVLFDAEYLPILAETIGKGDRIWEITKKGIAGEIEGKMKIKGVSGKMLKRMKQEYVKCPILKTDVQFVQCFICPNFQSRVMQGQQAIKSHSWFLQRTY